MKLPKLTVVIEKEGKWYVATCPELGVASQGRSFEEAEAMIRQSEATATHSLVGGDSPCQPNNFKH